MIDLDKEINMTRLEKKAAGMKWDPPAPGTEERKKMPASAFLSPSTRTFPYKVFIEGEWVVSEKGLRSAISVANFRGNSGISSKASRILEDLVSDEMKQSYQSLDDVLQHFGVPGMKWGVRREQKVLEKKIKKEKRREEKKIRKASERKDIYENRMTKKEQQAYDRLTDNDRNKYWSDRFWNGSYAANQTLNLYGDMNMKEYATAKRIKDGSIAVTKLLSNLGR